MAAGSADPPLLSHFRDRDRFEVDFVLERGARLVGIEVKAAATVKPADFAGLRRLREAAGDAFSCGVVLHDGDRIQRVGDGLFAVPVSQLRRSARRIASEACAFLLTIAPGEALESVLLTTSGTGPQGFVPSFGMIDRSTGEFTHGDFMAAFGQTVSIMDGVPIGAGTYVFGVVVR